jgi:hypothetical protein
MRPQRASVVVSRPLFQVVMLVFGGPDAPRASECLDPSLLQIDETLQVVSSDLPVQVQPCACQANRAQRLAAHLCQAREHVLDAGTRLGDAMIAPLLGLRDRLALAAFALDVHAPPLFAQSLRARHLHSPCLPGCPGSCWRDRARPRNAWCRVRLPCSPRSCAPPSSACLTCR